MMYTWDSHKFESFILCKHYPVPLALNMKATAGSNIGIDYAQRHGMIGHWRIFYVAARHDKVITKQNVISILESEVLFCFLISFHGIADFAKFVAFPSD